MLLEITVSNSVAWIVGSLALIGALTIVIKVLSLLDSKVPSADDPQVLEARKEFKSTGTCHHPKFAEEDLGTVGYSGSDTYPILGRRCSVCGFTWETGL